MLAIVLSPATQSSRAHAEFSRTTYQANPREDRPHPGRAHRGRVPVLGHAAQAHEGVRQAELPLRPGPLGAARAVLRMGAPQGRQARAPRASVTATHRRWQIAASSRRSTTPSATRCPWSPIRRCDASTTPVFNCRHSMAPRRKFRPMPPDYKHKETQMLKGKSALITGSTSGIGLGVATALAEAGANVILNGFGEASEIERIRAGLAERTGVEVIYDVAVKRPLP